MIMSYPRSARGLKQKMCISRIIFCKKIKKVHFFHDKRKIYVYIVDRFEVSILQQRIKYSFDAQIVNF